MILATLLPSVVAGLAREADSVNARDRNSSRDEELLESSRSQLSYGADAGSWTSSPFVAIAIAGVLTMVAAVALGCVFRKSDKNRKEKDESAPPGSPKESRAVGRMSESMMESRVMGRMAPGGNQAKVADASKGAKGAGKGKAVGKTPMLRSTVVMGPNSPATYQDIERKHQPRSTRYGLAKSQRLGKWTASTTDDGDSVDETMAKNAKAKGKGGAFGSLKGGVGGKSGNHDDVPMHRAPAVVADVSEPSDVIKRNTLALPGASPAAPKMPGPILTGTLNLQASPEWLKVIRNENADIATVMPPPPPTRGMPPPPPTKGMPPPPPTKGMPPPPPTKGMPPPPLMKGKSKGLEPNKLPKPAPPVLTGGTLQLGQCNEWNEFLATQKEGGAMQALMKESPRKMPDWLKDPNDGKDGGPPERRPHTSKNPTMLINDEDNQDTPICGKGSDDKRLDVPSPTQRKLSSERRQDAPSPGKPIADRRHEAPSPGKLGTPIPVKRKKRRPPMEDGEEGSPRLSPRVSNRNASPSDGSPLDSGDERRKRPLDMDRSPRKKPKEGNEDSIRRRKERQKKMKEKEKDNEKEKEKDKEKVI